MVYCERTTTRDFDKNTYKETDGNSSGDAKFNLGSVTLGGKLELDNELNAKVTSKFSLGDSKTKITGQEQESSK